MTDPVSNRRGFIVTEHRTRVLHWDLRLEDDGVLLSWALPKGEPVDPAHSRLAIRTDDHPLDFLDPSAAIAKAEAAGSTVVLTDTGTYDRETWLPASRIVVTLHGDLQGGRRLRLIRTTRAGQKNSWLAQRLL